MGSTSRTADSLGRGFYPLILCRVTCGRFFYCVSASSLHEPLHTFGDVGRFCRSMVLVFVVVVVVVVVVLFYCFNFKTNQDPPKSPKFTSRKVSALKIGFTLGTLKVARLIKMCSRQICSTHFFVIDLNFFNCWTSLWRQGQRGGWSVFDKTSKLWSWPFQSPIHQHSHVYLF